MTEKEWDLAWLKAATQRWEAKPKPLLEDGTKVWTKSRTLPLSLTTYSMYAFLSSDSNLCWASFHTIFGTSAAPLPAPGMVVLAISLFLSLFRPCVCLFGVLFISYKHYFIYDKVRLATRNRSILDNGVSKTAMICAHRHIPIILIALYSHVLRK